MKNGGATSPVVFLGPTLAAGEAERVLPAVYRPPAAQGAIISAVQRYRPSAILLIDGVFQGEPAVRHKEILWAMSRGIPVLGASSMGALRAAEVWRQGMIGVGLIFRWYRRYALLPDDAVAVLHGRPEFGAPALTHSLIDLRMTVRRAARAGRIDGAARNRLESAAAALNFRERTLARMIDQAALGGALDHPRQASLEGELRGCLVEQKRADALAALRLLRDRGSKEESSARPTSEFVTTTAFLRDLLHARIHLDVTMRGGHISPSSAG
jgi:hypothetical protein